MCRLHGGILSVAMGVFLWACGGAEQVGIDAEPIFGQTVQHLDLENCPLDHVFDLEHFIEVEPGVTLHVIEKFSLRSILRFPRRAILMLPATFVTNEFYDAEIPGDDSYNAMLRLAKAGFFAFSVSWEGYGQSSYPADGRSVTFERTLSHMGKVIRWIRTSRWAPKVDLMGASFGSSLAITLGGVESSVPRSHIGRIVLTSVVYKQFSQFVLDNFFTPEMQALLRSLPYIETVAEMYLLVMTEAEPEAFYWAATTFPGVYATGPTLEGLDLPVSSAEAGRAPALQAWGTHDPVNTAEDVALLQQEYGGPIELLEIEGGGHSPLFEPGREFFWAGVFDFLRVDDCHRCPTHEDLERLRNDTQMQHMLIPTLGGPTGKKPTSIPPVVPKLPDHTPLRTLAW